MGPAWEFRSPRLLTVALLLLVSRCHLFAVPAMGVPQTPPSDTQQAVLQGARREAARKTPYIMDYEVIRYPGGDVTSGTGVCTDLVVRAFRNAGIDLQQLVHEDRKAHPEAYPTQLWEAKKADSNIDHRRCQNLTVWFRRHALSLTTATDADSLGQWQPGDVVFFVRKGASHPWHVAVVSDRRDTDGVPFIVDSYPPFTSESHRLDTWAPIHSHYRFGAGRSGQTEKATPKRTQSPTNKPSGA